jgi:hypothetical protein
MCDKTEPAQESNAKISNQEAGRPAYGGERASRPDCHQKVREHIERARYFADQLHKLQHLQRLLEKNPEVALIHDLMRELGI